MISGNHDSARRLGVGAGPDRRAPASTCAPTSRAAHRPVAARRPGTDRSPSTGCPTSSPTRCASELGLRRARATPRCSRAAMDAGARRPRRRARGTRSVVLAHAFVTGGEPSDSERDITRRRRRRRCPRRVFDGVDYAALGPPARLPAAHRPGALLRLPAGVLLLRGAPPQEHVAGRPRRRRRRGRRARRLPSGARPLARIRGRLDDLLTATAATGARGPLGPGHPHRPAPPARADGAAAPALPARPRPGFDPEGAGADARCLVRRPRLRGRTDLRDRRATSWRTCAARPRRRPERALLRDAFEARPRGRRGGGADAPAPAGASPPSGRSPAPRPSTSTSCPPPGCSCCTGRPAPARPASSTPCASPSTARSPAPGHGAARLRSDHAADGTPHRVVLELTLRGRRLEITRPPAVGAPQEARHRHDDREGQGHPRGARPRRRGRTLSDPAGEAGRGDRRSCSA